MNNEHLVRFDKWCPACVHKDESEFDGEIIGSCYDCLYEVTAVNSTKPLNYKEDNK